MREWTRIARARTADGPVVVVGNDGDAALAIVGDRTFTDLPELLEAAGGDVAAIGAGDSVDVTEADLLPSVARPRKIICVGLNYRAHADEGGAAYPDYPVLFPKWDNALTGPYDEIPLPLESTMVDYESELAFVFGRRARRVAAADAASVVFGYTAANDVSMRDFQRRTSQWGAGKTWDRATPLGPWIVPAGACGGAEPSLTLRGRINGDLVQEARTSEMIFGVPELVEYITTVMTVEPGDLVLTGTCSGVGASFSPPRWLTDGDVAEVEIEGIGRIRNCFVAESTDGR